MKSTFLKVMAIITLIFGIIAAVGAVGMLALGGVVGGMISSAGIDLTQAAAEAGIENAGAVVSSATALLTVSMIIMVADAAAMVVAGVLGIGASSDVAKVKRAVIIGIIMIAIAVVSLIISGVNGLISWTNFTNLIIPVLYFVAAFRFKKQSEVSEA